MIISKILLYGSLFTGIFAISTISTVTIKKQIDKTPVRDVVETSDSDDEDDDDYEILIPKTEVTDSELLIANLMEINNLEADINASISYLENEFTISGDAFLCLENLTSPLVDASINIDAAGYYDFNVDATYIDDTIYLSINDKNVKLKTSDINQITSLFNKLQTSIELPEAFQNITLDTILDNLDQTTSERTDEQIIYKMNILEGLPTITVTSDFDHILTGLSFSDYEIEGISISLNVSTNVLPQGANKVVVPENENKVYVDASNYFGLVDQVIDIVAEQKLNLSYDINVSSSEEKLLSTAGRASVDFSNGLLIDIDGCLYNQDKSLSAPYYGGYDGEEIYFSYDNAINLYYETSHIDDLSSSISKLTSNDLFKGLASTLDDISIPLLQFINAKDYHSLIDKYEGIYLSDDLISIKVNNSLLSEDNSSLFINLHIDENGINSVDINNIQLSSFTFDLSLGIDKYQPVSRDLNNFINVSHIDKVLDQFNDLLINKKAAFDIFFDINELNVNGYVQFDLINQQYQLDIDIVDGDSVHNIKLDSIDDNFYLSYNDKINLVVSPNDIQDMLDILLDNITDTDSLLYEYSSKLVDVIENNDFSLDLQSIIFAHPIKQLVAIDDGLNVVINKDLINLDDDLSIKVGLDNHQINSFSTSIDIADKDIAVFIGVKQFNDGDIINDNDKCISADNIINIVKYVEGLGEDSQQAVIQAVKDVIENKQTGVSYSFFVSRDEEEVFTTSGQLDIDFSSLEDLSQLALRLNGNMINNEHDLSSLYDICLLDGTIYFKYISDSSLDASINKDLMISYDIDSINDLINLFKKETSGDTNPALASFLDGLLPDGSTLDAPLFKLIKNNDYLSLLDYFIGIREDGRTLYVDFDAAILGADSGVMELTINVSDNNLLSINIKNIYAFGYNLDCVLSLQDYQQVEVINKDDYSKLDYINDIIKDIKDIIDSEDQKYALSLTGKFADTSFKGSTQFALGSSIDGVKNNYGVVKLAVNSGNTTHYINLDIDNYIADDVTTSIADDGSLDAASAQSLKDSKVMFTYADSELGQPEVVSNRLYGSLSIGSIVDVIDLIKDLATGGDSRFEKYAALLSSDFSNSVLFRILKGDIESILYSNLINEISYKDNTYTVVLDGSILKLNEEDEVSPLTIKVGLNEHKLSTLSINGNILGKDIEINLNRTSWSDSYGRFNVAPSGKKVFDFSNVKTLLNYLLNTAKENDFTITGELSLLDIKNVPVSAQVHISQEKYGDYEYENVFAKVSIDEMPDLENLLLKRYITYYIYEHTEFKDGEPVVYQEVYIDVERKGLFITYEHKSKKLTLDELMEQPVYYIVDYSLGISLGDSSDDGTKNINISTFISDYVFNEATPSWEIVLGTSQLSSLLTDASITISGNQDSGLLSHINASLSVDIIIKPTITLDADLNCKTPISSDVIAEIKNHFRS